MDEFRVARPKRTPEGEAPAQSAEEATTRMLQDGKTNVSYVRASPARKPGRPPKPAQPDAFDAFDTIVGLLSPMDKPARDRIIRTLTRVFPQ